MPNEQPVTKLSKFGTYCKHFLIGIIALPIALVISTALVVIAVFLLPLLWALITLFWINSIRLKLIELENK